MMLYVQLEAILLENERFVNYVCLVFSISMWHVSNASVLRCSCWIVTYQKHVLNFARLRLFRIKCVFVSCIYVGLKRTFKLLFVIVKRIVSYDCFSRITRYLNYIKDFFQPCNRVEVFSAKFLCDIAFIWLQFLLHC